MGNNSVWEESYQHEPAPSTLRPLINGVAPPPLKPPLPNPMNPQPGEIWIDVGENFDPGTRSEAIKALITRNWLPDLNCPRLYNYDDRLVYMEVRTDGTPTIKTLPAAVLSNLLSDWACWKRVPKSL